jgi:hypothetical protein
MRGKGTKLGEGERDYYQDYYVVSGLLRSGQLRSGLLRTGKLRSALALPFFQIKPGAYL